MNNFKITPITHATLVFEWNGKIIYTDPAEGLEILKQQPKADIILITDIHSDHIKPDELTQFTESRTKIICPQAVAMMLPEHLKNQAIIMSNGETKTIDGFTIEAMPMYNMPETPDAFHPKGRGNGYIIEADKKRVYLSGDTGNIPEMSTFKNIDLAFLCMNLPYTMDVEDAAKATLALNPKEVIPYHYGQSDTNKFKQLVENQNQNIKISLIEFYPKN